jgi:hypothetical protein
MAGRITGILLLTSVAGCAGEVSRDESLGSSLPLTVDRSPDTPPPVATVVSMTGTTVEFYEFGRGVLLSESGPAYAELALHPELLNAHDQRPDLSEIWNSVAPTRRYQTLSFSCNSALIRELRTKSTANTR